MISFLFPFFHMRFLSLALTALLLSACHTTVISDEQRDSNLDDGEAGMEVSYEPGETIKADKEESFIAFTGAKGSIISHEGAFDDYDFSLTLSEIDPGDLEDADLTVTVQIESIRTDTDLLTTHLLSSDFFDAEKFPQAVFIADTITEIGPDMYRIDGGLAIKDVALPISVEAEITDQSFVAEFVIDRTDYGVGEPTGGVFTDIDHDIPVEVHIVFAPSEGE